MYVLLIVKILISLDLFDLKHNCLKRFQIIFTILYKIKVNE